MAALALCLAITAAAAAAESGPPKSASVRLQVRGSLIPGACAVHLTGDGLVDYGHIPRHSLPDGEPFQLATHTVQFTVSCEDPMTIRVTARDEKSGTAVAGLLPGEDDFAFGLGSVNDINIGQFRIQSVAGTFFAQDAHGRTGPVDILSALARRPTWVRREPAYFRANGESHQSYAAPGRLDPGVYRSVTGAFRIETFINRRGQLPGGNIPLAGLATIEILY